MKMMITIVVLAVVACALRSVEANTCAQCQDRISGGHCVVGDSSMIPWYGLWCSGYCGYKCSGGVLTRICSDNYSGVDPARNSNYGFGTVYNSPNGNGDLYYFCSTDQCSNADMTCAAMIAATTTAAPTTTTTTTTAAAGTRASNCYDCVVGTGRCFDRHADLASWYPPPACNGYCGFRCHYGQQTRICSDNYRGVDPVYNGAYGVGTVYTGIDGSDKYYFCSGDKCNWDGSGVMTC